VLRVGGELVFWQKSLEGSDAYLRGIEGVVLWHPSPPGGFLRVGKRGFLTPSLMSIAVPAATIDTPAGPLDNMVATLFFAGLGITFR